MNDVILSVDVETFVIMALCALFSIECGSQGDEY